MSFLFNSWLLAATISTSLPCESPLFVTSIKSALDTEQQSEDYGDLLKGEKIKKDYILGNEEDYTVHAKQIKRLYYYKRLSSKEFHNRYFLYNKLWTSHEDAMNTDNHKTLLQASIVDMVDWLEPTPTHNLKLIFNLGELFFRPTLEEYKSGSAQRTIYGCFVSKLNHTDKIIFSLTITMRVKKNGKNSMPNIFGQSNNQNIISRSSNELKMRSL